MALRRCIQPWVRFNMQLVERQVPQAAYMYSSKADEQQASEQKVQEQKPVAEQAAAAASATVAAPAASTAAAPATTSKSKAEEEWTEVVDEKSGQTYYWNEKTGETTDLGQPRPKTRFRDPEWEQTAKSSGPFQEGWREPPGRDHTYYYSVLGVGVGIAVGWFTQYLH